MVTVSRWLKSGEAEGSLGQLWFLEMLLLPQGLWASILCCDSRGSALHGCDLTSDLEAFWAAQAEPRLLGDGVPLCLLSPPIVAGWWLLHLRERGVALRLPGEEAGTHPLVTEWRKERKKWGLSAVCCPAAADHCSGAASLPDCSSHPWRHPDVKSWLCVCVCVCVHPDVKSWLCVCVCVCVWWWESPGFNITVMCVWNLWATLWFQTNFWSSRSLIVFSREMHMVLTWLSVCESKRMKSSGSAGLWEGGWEKQCLADVSPWLRVEGCFRKWHWWCRESPAHIGSCDHPQGQLGFHQAQPCALYSECKDPGSTAAFTGWIQSI